MEGRFRKKNRALPILEKREKLNAQRFAVRGKQSPFKPILKGKIRALTHSLFWGQRTLGEEQGGLGVVTTRLQ